MFVNSVPDYQHIVRVCLSMKLRILFFFKNGSNNQLLVLKSTITSVMNREEDTKKEFIEFDYEN